MSQICQAESFQDYWTSRIGYIEQQSLLRIPEEQVAPAQSESCIDMIVNDQKLLEESVALAIYTHPSKRRKTSNTSEKRLIDLLYSDEKISR